MSVENTLRVRERCVGSGSPSFIAAEIGVNHNGDLELAKELVHAAVLAGADGVKFQNYRTEDFLSDRRLTYCYRSQGQAVTEPQWDIFKRCELKPGWLPQLKSLCDELGVAFFSTPVSEDGVRELVDLGVPLLKSGSDYLTNLPLLEFMSSTGVPLVVSTGMGDQPEIDQAVEAIRRGGKSKLILLQCTSSYPTRPEDTNLRRMITLRERYGVPVGFSDHTQEWMAAVQATTMGACFLEKHFTLDHNLAGPDHWFSSTPNEFAELVRQIRTAEQRLGSGVIEPAVSERDGRITHRLSLVATRDLSPGVALSTEFVSSRRPGDGIVPSMLAHYLGRRLTRAVAAGCQLRPEDFA